MSVLDPEREFISHGIAAYNGMRLEECVFCQLADYSGRIREYKLDIVTSPEKADVPRPVVIFVHGGGFVQPHDKRQGYIPIFARALTAAGYAVVSPDYPVFDNVEQRAKWNNTCGADRAAEALEQAWLFVKGNAERYNFDPERIAIMGGSAGGMACFYFLENYRNDIKTFGNCWGAPWSCSPNVSGFPPTISIHGTADQAVNYELEAPIHAALEKAGIPNKLITIEGAGHTPLGQFGTYMPTVLEWLETYLK